MTFDEANRLFLQDEINTLSGVPEGLKFLKLRSLSRKEHLKRLFDVAGQPAVSSSASGLFREAYEADLPDATIDAVIAEIYCEESAERVRAEDGLVSELYKMTVFDWGGLHQNSLEKTIVDNYLKKITSFDTLEQKIENDLHHSMRGFVLCQWYNHWTSIIIEDIFRRHPAVLPAVGLVKKIDFFVRQVPFDLKVTYFPEGFIADRRREAGLRPELTVLKQVARGVRIHFDANALSGGKLLEDLWKKLRDHPAAEAQSTVMDLHTHRMRLINESAADPSRLIRWLYENQGVRRFDSSNRLFLVLVDQSNFFDSWKLKRAKPLLEAAINRYLDRTPPVPGRQVTFAWEGRNYTSRSDVLFILPPSAA
ncbi:MAG: hypothetical protein EPN47_01335 [Acidobacteria bacterium]|nr:MAG: hypothetical protein EPN47_01335 [Acidobacteriota bacterium]